MAFAGGGKQKTDKGLELYAQTPIGYSDSDHNRWKGELYTVPASTISTFDVRVEEEIRIFGGHYWVQDAHAGDKMTFQVVDVDNVLGYGANTVITEYISSMPVPPWNHERNLESPTAALIPSGLYLRVVYQSAGGTGTLLGVTYKWFLQSS